MTDIQKTLFTLLTEIDGICRRHGISYFLSENTALAAVQIKAFGLERLNAEILMRVPDLERFIEVCEEELPEGRSLESWLNSPSYGEFGCRYVDDDSLFLDLANYYRYSHYGLGVRISVLRDQPAGKLGKKLARIMEEGFESTFFEDKLEAPEYNERYEHFARSRMKTDEKRLNFTRKMFKELCKAYTNPGSERCFVKSFRTEPQFFKNEWFSKAETVELEGRKFPAPAKQYFTALYGADYKHIWLPGRPETQYVIADAAIPYREYLKAAADYGLSIEQYAHDRQVYNEKMLAGKPMVDKIRHYWDLLFRTGDRIELYEHYAPVKDKLLRLEREGRFDELNGELMPYRERLMKNYELGLGLCFDPEIFGLMCRQLEREGEGSLVNELRELIPPEHTKPLVIKEYDDE